MELRDTYEKLQVLEDHRDQLVHMTIHDMRSPLTVTYNVLQSISRGEVPPNRICETAKAGVQATRRVIDLATLALDASRMEGGSLPLGKETVDPGALARSAAEEIGQLAGSRKLVVSAPETPIYASCDDAFIRRGQNILVDATGWRYTSFFAMRGEPGGIKRPTASIRSVSDTGLTR